jgi:hypothetical protein
MSRPRLHDRYQLSDYFLDQPWKACLCLDTTIQGLDRLESPDYCIDCHGFMGT